MKPVYNCRDCMYAKWQRGKGERILPQQVGKCTWLPKEEIKVSAAMDIPHLSAKGIWRDIPYEDCPVWELG